MYIKKSTGYVVPLENVCSKQLSNIRDLKAGCPSSAYIKNFFGYVVRIVEDVEKGLLDVYYPPTGQSYKWKHWVTSKRHKTVLRMPK